MIVTVTYIYMRESMKWSISQTEEIDIFIDFLFVFLSEKASWSYELVCSIYIQ